jgi:ATP-binding cassette subfamily B protein
VSDLPNKVAVTAPMPDGATAWREGAVLLQRAFGLVWQTSQPLSLGLLSLTVVAGALPAGIAWVGGQIVDAVVAAAAGVDGAGAKQALEWVALEALLVAMLAAAQRGLSFCQSLLRAQLGERVNELILEKALTLSLAQFEDAEFYDKMTRARREASSRPLALVSKSLGLVQNLISLTTFGILLIQFSPWAVWILLLAGLPAFIAEAKFSGDAFRLFRWRAPETRMQMYLETVLAREDHAKEVKLFGLGRRLLQRYRKIFERLYREDRALTLRRDSWGLALGLLGTLAFYGAYAWVALEAVGGRITLGQMTLYLMLFRQGQSAVSASLSAIGGMYEDRLYLSTLYELLETPTPPLREGATCGPDQADGLRFERVSFTYPGSEVPTLSEISLHIAPGTSLALVGANGAGKTTLIKLLAGLYAPTEGRILLDGLDIQAWDEHALRRRIAVIFQDFVRYQFQVGENIGAGDEPSFDDAARWQEAARKGRADQFIDTLPEGYSTQLGKWFKDGRELSGGQWQRIALSRAFMRREADILVLDEPTSAMDAEAEAEIFARFRELAIGKMLILISHRFSTVRLAAQIAVIDQGRITEFGDHASLMAKDGLYARLFRLQAAGYSPPGPQPLAR